MRSSITTHILDTSTGKPAAGVTVCLEIQDSDGWRLIANKSTDDDGRIADLMAYQTLTAGIYRLTFKTKEYFVATARESFFPKVTIEFEITNLRQHYHVPLLLSPYGFTTYRGS